MPLRTSNDAPAKGPEVIAAYLGSLRNDISAVDLFGGGRNELWTCPAFRSYVASLADVSDGSLLKLQPRGWRYVVCTREGSAGIEQPLFAAEVSRDLEAIRVTHLSKSPNLAKSLALLAEAEKKDSVKKGSYEVRLLEVIGLSLSAWWLRDGGQAGNDLFIPLTTSMPELNWGTLYPKEQFLAIVARHVDQRLKVAVEV